MGGKNHHGGGWVLEEVSPRDCGISIITNTQNLMGPGPVQSPQTRSVLVGRSDNLQRPLKIHTILWFCSNIYQSYSTKEFQMPH